MRRPSASDDRGSTTVEQMLASARSQLRRLSPRAAHAAMRTGAVLIDIRSDRQRTADGIVPGAYSVSRNVLEWRLDPACAHRDLLLTRPDSQLVLFCNDGYQSSLTAATVQGFGVSQVTDVSGGFQAWRADGLPVRPHAPAGATTRALDCPCGQHLEATDDELLLVKAHDHVDQHHPELDASAEHLRERIAADAYDVGPDA